MNKSTNNLKLNGITALMNRLTVVISGLVLPKLFINAYGSQMNGLISTVTQYLSLITFLDMGVGAVVQAALYKPLASNNTLEISRFIVSSKQYFRRIAISLLFYIVFLFFYLPSTISEDINTKTVILMILVISITFFSQYYFGIVNQLLITADQRGYVNEIIQIVTVILNTLFSIILVKLNYDIIFVKFVTALVFFIRPVFLYLYVKKYYKIDYDIEVNENILPQKWNGMAQHIAYTVQNSTDIIILSLFSTLENISVYSVYFNIVQGIKMILSSLANGIRPFFGNLLAKNDKLLLEYFNRVEWLIHNLVVLLFGLTSILVTPFVFLYTAGITDVNYYQPLFGKLLTFAYAVFCMRLPYQMIILSAGHFKETQLSSIIEVIINIIISVILVLKYGLVGVAIGTLLSMLYRTLYLLYYLKHNIIKRKIIHFIKITSVDILNIFIFGIFNNLYKFEVLNVKDWIVNAVVQGIVLLTIQLISNLIFYRENVILILKNKLI